MQIKLPIIDEPETGLCTIADLTGNGKMSKLLISMACHNNYVSENLYNQLGHENPQLPVEVRLDAAYYLNNLTDAKASVIKALPLPGHTLTDVPVIVTPSFPAYQCDMVIGLQILKRHWFKTDPASGFVIISDEKLGN